jgi:hypothetical protein
MSEEEQSEKNNKKRVIDAHIHSLNVQVEEKTAAKEEAKKSQDELGDIIVDLDKDISQSQQERDFLKENQDRIVRLDSDNWGTYVSLAEHQMRNQPTAINLHIDLAKVASNIIPLNSVVTSGLTSTSSDYCAVYGVVVQNYSGDNKFLSQVVKYEPTDDFWHYVETIKQEMNKRIPGSGDNFEKAICRFTTEADKSPVLLDIRSCIWYQFFDKIIPDESQYSKINWYKTCSHKKRYCQTRYLIQNSNDVPVPSATDTEIDRLSYEMERLFHEFSEEGKLGDNPSHAEQILKAELIPTFKSVLTFNI